MTEKQLKHIILEFLMEVHSPEAIARMRKDISARAGTAVAGKEWDKGKEDNRALRRALQRRGKRKKLREPESIPLSIFKRQKDKPELRSDSGEVEKPLTSFMQKDLGFSPTAVNQIAKNIARALKGKGFTIAENIVKKEIKNYLLESDLEEILESVSASAEGTKQHHKQFAKLKQYLDRATEALKKLKAAPDNAKNRKKKKYWEKAIRTAQMKARTLGIDLERVKGERGEEKSQRKQQFKQLAAIAKKAGYGFVASAVINYAVKMGHKDSQFMSAFGDEPEKQLEFIQKISFNLIDQLYRRGQDSSFLGSKDTSHLPDWITDWMHGK